MKTQLINNILQADSGNMFLDFETEAEIRTFLEGQTEGVLKGIAFRCGIN